MRAASKGEAARVLDEAESRTKAIVRLMISSESCGHWFSII
jgi:hypothetical protein